MHTANTIDTQPTLTKQLWRKTPLALKIFVPGLAALTLLAMSGQPPAVTPPPAPEPPTVSVIKAQAEKHRLNIKTQGTVAPRREINLVAQVGGEVISVERNFVDGGHFQARQMLIQIDPSDYEFALAERRARLAKAKELLASERGRAHQAKREWRDLGNESANQLFLRKPQLASAQAEVTAAKAAVAKAELDLKRTAISVPFEGRIAETFVDLGQFISPGTPIAQVFDSEVAEVRLPLTDAQAALIDLPLGFQADTSNPGPLVELSATVAGYPRYWQGRITRTEASLDTRSRMYYAIAEIDQPFKLQTLGDKPMPLVMGLFVGANIEGRQLDNVIKLPRDSVFNRDQLYRIDNNQIIRETVHVLHQNADSIWIQDTAVNTKTQLSGQQVLPGGQGYVSEGLQVSVELNSQEQPTSATIAQLNSTDEVQP